jgi:hypothetical protein
MPEQTFEQHRTAFVSVTQHFHSGTSMGRLVLNVLLSFAPRHAGSDLLQDVAFDECGSAPKSAPLGLYGSGS